MSPDDRTTDGGSKYVVATGEGYLTTRTLGTTNIDVSLAGTDLDWQRDDLIHVYRPGPRRLIVTPERRMDAGLLTRLSVQQGQCRALQVSLSNSLLANLAEPFPDDIRVYEDANALVVVDAADDPRVPGGEDGGE